MNARCTRRPPQATEPRPWNNRWVPNGKQGDHPLTDVVAHGLEAFGSPIDDLIVEIARLGEGTELRQGELGELIWDLWPKWGRRSGDEADFARLESMLIALRDRLAP